MDTDPKTRPTDSDLEKAVFEAPLESASRRGTLYSQAPPPAGGFFFFEAQQALL